MQAGAGFSIKGIPLLNAFDAMYCTVANGISNCINMMVAASIKSSMFCKSFGVRAALAPEATAITFSACLSTMINAIPEGSAASVSKWETLMPSCSKSVFLPGFQKYHCLLCK